MKAINPNYAIATVLSLATGALGCVFALTLFGWKLERDYGLLWLFKARGSVPAPSEVVIVNIDKKSAIELNQAIKIRDWSRSLHAELIDKLVERDASVIVFDVFFDESRPTGDSVLAAAIARSRRVTLFQRTEQDTGEIVNPTPELAAAPRALACVLRIRKSSGDWYLKKSTTVLLPSISFKAGDVRDCIVRICFLFRRAAV